jgi:hypothetical protein
MVFHRGSSPTHSRRASKLSIILQNVPLHTITNFALPVSMIPGDHSKSHFSPPAISQPTFREFSCRWQLSLRHLAMPEWTCGNGPSGWVRGDDVIGV